MVPSLIKVYVATIYIVQLTNNNYQTPFEQNAVNWRKTREQKERMTVNVVIVSAEMHRGDEMMFVGSTVFRAEGDKSLYEITFMSKNGKDWDYSLHFTEESGDEEELLRMDELLENDDDLYNMLLDAALDAYPA